ncbi:hypothetical protein ABZ639_04995 [Saccharomonospora sp. NPDC006951]
MMHFPDAAAWEAWLAEHHDSAAEAWLRIAKKKAPASSVTIEQALDVALCFGWIDSNRRSLDEHYYLQRYSRRRRGSPWSAINVGHARRLIAAGRMRASGLAEFTAAREEGRWESAEVPAPGEPPPGKKPDEFRRRCRERRARSVPGARSATQAG